MHSDKTFKGDNSPAHCSAGEGGVLSQTCMIMIDKHFFDGHRTAASWEGQLHCRRAFNDCIYSVVARTPGTFQHGTAPLGMIMDFDGTV